MTPCHPCHDAQIETEKGNLVCNQDDDGKLESEVIIILPEANMASTPFQVYQFVVFGMHFAKMMKQFVRRI